MKVSIANEFSNDGLYDAWNGLLSQASEANAQLTYEWLSSCWEIFGDHQQLSLMTVADRGEIFGIAPLSIATVIDKAGLKLKKLAFVGDGLTDYHDLLIADEKREDVLRALLAFILNGKAEWDAIHFRNIRSDSPNLPILRSILGKTSFTFIERVNIRSPFIGRTIMAL